MADFAADGQHPFIAIDFRLVYHIQALIRQHAAPTTLPMATKLSGKARLIPNNNKAQAPTSLDQILATPLVKMVTCPPSLQTDGSDESSEEYVGRTD